MDKYFPGDSYHTPETTGRDWLDKLNGSGRFTFHLRFIGILLWARWMLARGKYDRTAYAETGYRIIKLIEKGGGRFHITGLDHIRAVPGAVVFVSNHMSALENNVQPGIIAPIKPVTYVVKASLLRYPIFGPLLRSQDTIAVHRANPREDFQLVMSQGQELLQGGTSIIVYPEATRRETFDPANMNTLGVKLAQRASVPIIPVAVKTDFWRNGRILRDFGPLDRSQPIHFAYGEAIDTSQKSRLVHRCVVEHIAAHLAAWTGLGD